MTDLVINASKRCACIEYLGKKSHSDLIDEMKSAAFLVVPSIWYETFGLVAIEAFACGTPVVSSKIGSLESVIENHVSGLHFKPGDTNDLRGKIRWAFTHPSEMLQLGLNARRIFERKYMAQTNYEWLINIYQETIKTCKSDA